MPQDVLECVKKHRLFPQAEASIRLFLPDIQKRFHLGLEVCFPHSLTQSSSASSVHTSKGFHIICIHSAGPQPICCHGCHTDPK